MGLHPEDTLAGCVEDSDLDASVRSRPPFPPKSGERGWGIGGKRSGGLRRHALDRRHHALPGVTIQPAVLAMAELPLPPGMTVSETKISLRGNFPPALSSK